METTDVVECSDGSKIDIKIISVETPEEALIKDIKDGILNSQHYVGKNVVITLS